MGVSNRLETGRRVWAVVLVRGRRRCVCFVPSIEGPAQVARRKGDDCVSVLLVSAFAIWMPVGARWDGSRRQKEGVRKGIEVGG